MGKALYRSYRALNFDEVIGQDHITNTLKNSLKSNSINHAYLLTGPRGVGKTSVARILAHQINGIDYESEQTPVDIIEIDAASNRRIDEIRDIKEKSRIMPVSAKYKVYIIDEVHMLTKEAFNALLKTLEEPPAHVVFILATTEFHKLPDTIVSRCVHFPFKPIDKQNLVNQLAAIARKEKINISDEAISAVAEHGRGSFRDGISILDQIRHIDESINIDHVNMMLGLAPKDLIDSALAAIKMSDPQKMVEFFNKLREYGADYSLIAKQLADRIYGDLINDMIYDNYPTSLLKSLLETASSPLPKEHLELTLISHVIESTPRNELPDLNIDVVGTEPVELTAPIDEEPIATVSDSVSSVASPDLWDKMLEQLKKDDARLYGIARMANYSLDGSKLELSFQFPFHNKRMSHPENIKKVKKILEDISGEQFDINLESSSSTKAYSQTNKADEPSSGINKNINNIFGSSEVLES